jgi:phosphoribosylformylglycinamidine synthase
VEPVNPASSVDVLALPPPEDLAQALLALLASPNIACKRWIHRQYDSTVRTNTLLGPGGDAAVVRVKGTLKALAISADGNGRYCWLDPYRGARLAVAEACRNVAASGALPIGATNCLNFGNPERPAVMGQLVKAIEGMGEACQALGVPITGGNVSLYNETDGRAIYPTPVVVVVGLLEDASKLLTPSFVDVDDVVYLVGVTEAHLGGSELVRLLHGQVAGRPPLVDLDAERRLHAFMLKANEERLLHSAHDLSDGGLAVALAECCFRGGEPGLGGRFDLPVEARPDVLLFSETPSRMLVSLRDEARFRELASHHGLRWTRLGTVGGERLTLVSEDRVLVDLPVVRLHEAWMSLERFFSSTEHGPAPSAPKP